MSIRRAGTSDVPALLPLINAHAAFEKSQADCDPDALAAAMGASLPEVFVWVALQGDEPVGYASATIDFSTWSARKFGYLDCLYVAENTRSGGVGRTLFETVQDHFKALEIDRLEWQTPDWNKRALTFYKRFGPTISSKLRFALSFSGE